jgi:lipopolysaccharide/colanic/teichoic acid biosynthesis glycosyltransferase
MTAQAYSEDSAGYGAARHDIGELEDHIVVHLPAPETQLWELDLTKGLPGATPTQLRIKRAIDIAVSALTLVLLSPLLLVLAAAVKFSSPGPALYWSNRVGKDGTTIRIAKFRSMYTDADERLSGLVALNEATGPIFKIKEDPRITPLGRYIRKLSLDELPQLWNVLTGEMSLVGPRPALPSEVATYSELERQRLLVKPGLTCIWQVSGRSDLDFETWMKMDLEYIETWTLSDDLALLVGTIPAVVTGKGAY